MDHTKFKFKKILLLIFIFSVAMGFLETSVVVYLRKIYYPQGFAFPLAPIESSIGITELLREAATLIMLISIGLFTGRTVASRFGWFVFSFGVWDISYYVFLKILLGWPSSLAEWDILFLIPVPWLGPVWAPCVVSLSMILLGTLIGYMESKGYPVQLKRKDWLLLIAGSLIVILSFTLDYFQYAIHISNTVTTDKAFLAELSKFIPSQFNWWIFAIGQALILFTIYHLSKKFTSNSVAERYDYTI